MKEGISVIIPVYNRERLVSEAIRSVLNQQYKGLVEIILSDDGSSDGTLAVLHSFGSRIKVVLKPADCRSQGASASRNRGLKASTQPLICFLDSDDFYLPGHFEKMTALLRSGKDLGFVFCRTLAVKEENGSQLYKPWTHQYIFPHDILNPSVTRDGVVNTNCFMFRREVFSTVGYFNEGYTNGEDIDLWLRISEQYKGGFSDHYGAVYRTHHAEDQLTRHSVVKINSCLLNIYNDAVSRYIELGLRDSNRLFELRHQILHRKYSDRKLFYLFKYISLIARFPLNFLRRAPVFFYEMLEKNSMKNWVELKEFL